MKYFAADWERVFAALPAWEALPLEARRAVLAKMKPSGGVSGPDLGSAEAAVRASGVAEESKTGRRLTPREEFRPLLLLFRALDRQRIWDVPAPGVLADYLKEHFTGDEGVVLLHGSRYLGGYVDRGALVDRVTAEEWLEAFLAADTPEKAAAWERQRLVRGEAPRFAAAGVWEAARRMVKELAALPAPVPLRELPARFPGLAPRTLAAALEAGLRYLLLFAGLRDADLEPRVGPWPEAAARLRGEPPPAPVPVEPVETFEAAWRMEDLTTVLVAASAEPIRLRVADREIFARAREAIEARLLALPAWVAAAVGDAAGGRVETAAALLERLKLLSATRLPGGGEALAATRAGAAWLGLSDRDRLAALLEPMRASADRNPPSGYSYAVPAYGFFPVVISGRIRDRGLDLRAALTKAFLSLPEGFVSWRTFLEHARRAANPFLARAAEGAPPVEMFWSRSPMRRDWERLWGQVVEGFLAERLAALGGARLGRTADGETCFALTDAGRYLLGAADAFAYGHAAEGKVVVQPNFEVVFLAPAPRVEAQLARFAERVGAGPGVMFRLTRASVMAAAEAGTTREQVVEALRAASARELPANVVRQVGDWFAGVRRVSVRPALLLECPDAETAGRVRAAAGKQMRALTDTVLELPAADGKERSALVRRLRAAGIFVG